MPDPAPSILVPRSNPHATRPPTPQDWNWDLLSQWLHAGRVYVCVGNAAGAAEWREITPRGNA
jgi:hypothetical protein